ncbi:ABC transporter permease [Actinomyces gerencseriae]|uniref:ABC transporter permease n=1 Tax=Actinomyces gerencseriae TaxID=52769 RepID=UPI0023F08F12|nr:ABC transporter permease [Actinomyces gerencseriae]
MSTFKTCVRVVAAHRLYILIYLVLLSVFGLLTGMARSEDDSSQVTTATASVAVIDRDGSTISRGIKDYVESVGKVQPLEDSTQAIQDATAQNRVNYVLIIPAGYGQRLQQATRQGIEPPRMDTVIGYESASGALMNVRTDSYTGQVADYLATLTDDPTRAVALAEETMSHSAPAERIAQDTAPLSHSFLVYTRFSLYPLMAFAIVTISTLMTALGRRAVRSRLDTAPVSGGARNLGLLGACLVVGVVGWLWILGLGVAVFGAGSVTTSAPLLGVVGAALGSYMLVAVSLGFLMGQFGLGQNAANAVANIGGMALSFLAGAWVPIEWMPDAVARTARLTPGYWADQAISGAYNATSMSADVIRPLLVDCGICTLFAVAVLSVAMAVGRTRARSTL